MPYTIGALEVRRALAAMAARNETGASITYARLPTDLRGHVDWRHAATAGVAVTATVGADGHIACATTDGGAACSATEPALLPWPPTGPSLVVFAVLKLLVWYPMPVMPGSAEMPCADG